MVFCFAFAVPLLAAPFFDVETHDDERSKKWVRFWSFQHSSMSMNMKASATVERTR
jgi:hypothetical protein